MSSVFSLKRSDTDGRTPLAYWERPLFVDAPTPVQVGTVSVPIYGDLRPDDDTRSTVEIVPGPASTDVTMPDHDCDGAVEYEVYVEDQGPDDRRVLGTVTGCDDCFAPQVAGV
jgi:hypothetical protein